MWRMDRSRPTSPEDEMVRRAGCITIHTRVYKGTAGHCAPGMDPQGRSGQQAVHTVWLRWTGPVRSTPGTSPTPPTGTTGSRSKDRTRTRLPRPVRGRREHGTADRERRSQQVAPIDSTTGQPMSATAWRAYMSEFTAEIRAAFPSIEIVHNAIWFASSGAGTADPSIRREISANYINLERGVNDSGLTGGNGQWSLNALLSFVDQVHALGRAVVMDGLRRRPARHGIQPGQLLPHIDWQRRRQRLGPNPGNWWSGWNVNLGEATGARRTWSNLLRRDFTGGVVLVNPPDELTQTVTLSAPMRNVNGETVTSVTLPAGSGAILVGTPPSTTAPQPTTPAPTETILETNPVVSSPAPPSTGESSGIESSSNSSSISSSGNGSTPTSSTTTRAAPTQSTPPKHSSGKHRGPPRARLAARAARPRDERIVTTTTPREPGQRPEADNPVRSDHRQIQTRAHRVLGAGTQWR